jgi:hypothetical protein
MQEVIIEDKQKFLRINYPFADVPKLTDKKRCLHCHSIITVGDYKVFRVEDGSRLIYCPNAPDCDGTVIDWMPLS